MGNTHYNVSFCAGRGQEQCNNTVYSRQNAFVDRDVEIDDL